MMKRTQMFGIVSLAAMMVATASVGSAFAADTVSSDRLLPPGVLAYASFPNIPEFRARWDETTIGQLCSDPALADFRSDLEEKWQAASTDVETKIGVQLSDLLNAPNGELSIAVVKPPGKDIGVVAFLDFGESRDTVDKLLETASEKLAERDATRSGEEYEGTQIIVFTIPPPTEDDADEEDSDEFDDGFGDEDETEAKPRTVAYFVKDSLLVVGSSVELLENVLLRWDGTHPQTLASDEVYSYIQKQTAEQQSSPTFSWYLNPVKMLQAAIPMAAQANPNIQTFQMFLPLLGITDFKAMGGSFQLATDTYDSISHTLLYVNLPSTGLVNVFQFPATEQSPPSWVSDRASSYFSFNWDVNGAYAAVEALVDGFQGPGTLSKILDGVANQESGPKVHPKKDIIDQLTGKIQFTSDMEDPDDILSERFLLAVEVKDVDRMKDLLATIAETPALMIESRDYRGETIYETPETGPNNTSTAIGVSNGQLMVTNTVTFLEQVIRGETGSESLAESKMYQRIADQFPAKTSMLGYQRADTQMRAVWEMFRTGDAGNFIEGVDFSKLPPFESIKKYLQPTGSYAVPDKNGALLVGFSMPSDEE